MSALPSHERLRPGRQRLAREDVERSQRERLLVAMLSVVAEHGYAAATVGDVVARAEVSRSTFYAQFADKQACFLAAYDFALDLALRHLADAETSDGSWRERVLADLTTYLNLLADEPALALTLHVEVLAAGPAALEHRVALLGELAGRIANVDALARASDSALRELRPPCSRSTPVASTSSSETACEPARPMPCESSRSQWPPQFSRCSAPEVQRSWTTQEFRPLYVYPSSADLLS